MSARIRIDNRKKRITIMEPCTVIEFHRTIAGLWDDPIYMVEQTCTVRITDHIIEMINGWYISNPNMLSEGSLMQKGYWHQSSDHGDIRKIFI